ncbi:MAG: hypothetical protein L0Y38_00800, partial [Methylococcaceae bacterium]|nr:hypothetical protein [Methylococcaceae bacterium]
MRCAICPVAITPDPGERMTLLEASIRVRHDNCREKSCLTPLFHGLHGEHAGRPRRRDRQLDTGLRALLFGRS